MNRNSSSKLVSKSMLECSNNSNTEDLSQRLEKSAEKWRQADGITEKEQGVGIPGRNLSRVGPILRKER